MEALACIAVAVILLALLLRGSSDVSRFKTVEDAEKERDAFYANVLKSARKNRESNELEEFAQMDVASKFVGKGK